MFQILLLHSDCAVFIIISVVAVHCVDNKKPDNEKIQKKNAQRSKEKIALKFIQGQKCSESKYA